MNRNKFLKISQNISSVSIDKYWQAMIQYKTVLNQKIILILKEEELKYITFIIGKIYFEAIDKPR